MGSNLLLNVSGHILIFQVSEFHEYCKPHCKTQLSEFCQELTGVTQVN